MRSFQRSATTFILCACVFWQQANAQDLPIVVRRPKAPVIVRPYIGAEVPPVREHSHARLHSLIRAGALYLTVQDALGLAIESNLSLEVNRYGPLIADWQLQRAQAGGVLRGVTSGSSQIGSIAGGQGIAGSQQSAGLSTNNNTGNNISGGAVVSQIGPVTANLDPVLQNSTLYSHQTFPQSNTVQSQTSYYVDTYHIYNTSVQQGFLSGGYIQLSFRENYLDETAPTNILNPSFAPRLYAYVQHNLLQGFGTGVNSRFIRVARNNVKAARETFRSQLLDLVASVLNLYWDLVSSNETLKARQQALEIAQRFGEDTKREIGLGVLAKVEVFRADAEVSSRKQDVTIAQVAVRQQENLLKQMLLPDGEEDPLLEAASIVTLDRIQVPAADDLPPLRQLVTTAIAKRPDVAVSKIRMQDAEISALGTANGILPQLQGFAQTYNSGLAGTANPQPDGEAPDPYFVGGLGTALGQVFRRNFPSNRAGAVIQMTFGNRIAQGDYGVEQLQLRQGELTARRDMNQIVVDVSNQAIALRQARARYSAALNTRTVQQQLLQAEQNKFSFGTSTINDVIISQRALVAAQSAEIVALASYARARVSLDQVLGETLEKNNISIDDALSGRMPVRAGGGTQ
jgi:outer membrane protein TolC